MIKRISKVAVLGAGTMGSQLAAHLANAGVDSLLLDLVPTSLNDEEKQRGLQLEDRAVRNRLARQGLDRTLKLKPSPFFLPENARSVEIGNFEDDLGRCAEVDWIIEAVAENLEIKQQLLKRVDEVRRPGTIVSSNTSGLPLSKVAVPLSRDFKEHWLGTHFFNPPRYMKLVEVIPTPDTRPEVVRIISDFCDRILGKGVVLCHDTPNFIANRIGSHGILRTIQIMVEDGYSIEEVDAITGPAMGRPKTASFRTLDLVGLDVFAHVAQNMFISGTADEARETFSLPLFIQKMLTNRWFGNKARQGFYKKVKSAEGEDILVLDYRTMEYKPRTKPKFPSLEVARNLESPRDRICSLVHAQDRAGIFAWKILSDTLLYAAQRIPEVADDILAVDNAIRWGFNWEMGPFEIWDALGVEETATRLKSEGKKIPELVDALLASGQRHFYEYREGQQFYFDLATKTRKPTPTPEGVLLLRSQKDRARVIRSNAGASVIDLDDGVAAVEFHSKMNVIGADTVQMIQWALKEVEQNFLGLVIGNEGENFSAGANLFLLLMAAQEQEWDEIDLMVRSFQGANMAMKYASKPVVVAPFGMTLGGGTEVTLHGSRVCASAETYMGLVETGVGLIPAGGGTKEFLLRQLDHAGTNVDADLFPYVKCTFETIGMAKVSTSGREAQQLGFLRATDRVVMNRSRLLGEAKQMVLEMARAGYVPQKPRKNIPVLGNPALALMKMGLYLMQQAGYISEYDVVVGGKLAYILSGGDLSGRQEVSEQYLLDLEREAFLSLCGHRKTLERIQHILKTGKPLRN